MEYTMGTWPRESVATFVLVTHMIPLQLGHIDMLETCKKWLVYYARQTREIA